MMDVSGSMGREQKEIVRIEAFWIDTWLRSQYESLEVVYIVHDAAAKIVDKNTFFHLRESGGTKISSAYELLLDLVQTRYRADDYNIYPFHYSDGDNWSARDTDRCVTLLREELLPRVNQFCYGQVKSAYGSGQFKKDLDVGFTEEERLVTAAVSDRGDPRRHQGLPGAGALMVVRSLAAAEADAGGRSRRGSAAAAGPDLLRGRLRDARRGGRQRRGRLRRLPDALPVVALRHGVRASQPRVRLGSLEDLRAGDQPRSRRSPTSSAPTASWSRSW